MPELTVSMPVYNREKYLREAVESVLSQAGADFELIIVDDGSTDGTAEIINSFIDPRIIKIKNKRNKGISFCHNLVIEKSQAPFIVHVDSDDIVLPGAFNKILQKIKSSESIGLVHCYSYIVNEQGKMTRSAFHARRKWLLSVINQGVDYKLAFMKTASAANGLRTYRKDVFQMVGEFDEALRVGEDYDMAMRIIDKFDIKLVPEFLYSIRIHNNNTTHYPYFKNLRSWYQKLIVRSRLLRSGKVKFLKEKKYFIHLFGVRELITIIKSAPPCAYVSACFKILKRRSYFFTKFFTFSFLESIYFWLVTNLHWWPIGAARHGRVWKTVKDKNTAYYLWHYPVLSQTFIRREIFSLREAAIPIQVIADGYEDVVDKDLQNSIMKDTIYLFPQNKKKLAKYVRVFFLKNPLLFINLFFYIIFHRYSVDKNIRNDIGIFYKSIYLAGVLRENNLNHVHSPWADIASFVAMVAARFAGISYSVEARASCDIYRKTSNFALSDKLKNAEFIITNSMYNILYLNSFLGKKQSGNVFTVYEGLKLEDFVPNNKKADISKVVRILTVARLIEEKGLVYLIKACKILKDRGYKFRCEIIGDAEGYSYSYYISLRKLCFDLDLEEQVVFIGPLPFSKVMDKYKEADMFVLPCVIAKEGGRDVIPNSLLEAMAMKLPVISTNISAIPEIIDNGVSGILVAPNNEEVFAEEIIRLSENVSLRSELGENARKKIEQKFNININTLSLVSLFKGASDITALVLTTGEDTYSRAVESLNNQVLMPKEVITVKNISPFHKAVNFGVAQVKTRFFVQVDSDMVLDQNCLKVLRENFSDSVGVVIGFLRDSLVGKVSGVKMFRVECFEQVKFRDSLSPDTDFCDDILKYGWKTVFVPPVQTLGEHKRNFTPDYTYSKYLLSGGRYVYRGKFIQFQELVRKLHRNNNKISLIAEIALMHGVFIKDQKDRLSPQVKDQDFSFLKIFLNGNKHILTGLFSLIKIKSILNNNFNKEEETFFTDFISEKGDIFSNKNIGKVFEKFFRLGILFRRLNNYYLFKYFVNILGANNSVLFSVASIGLCHGIFFTNFDNKLLNEDYKVLDLFLDKDWRVSPYPDGYDFAFTIIHDADSAYSERLEPLFSDFDKLHVKLTVSTFVFWSPNDLAEYNRNIKLANPEKFIKIKAVPLENKKEAKFYKQLSINGHEIAMHTPSEISDTREEIIRAYEYFKKVFGYYPKVYIEHSCSNNKEAQNNEGSDPNSPYYNTDLLNNYGSWIWVDVVGSLTDKHEKFYDLLQANGSPFNIQSFNKYGILKGFIRTGKWSGSGGDDFLDWYSLKNIDLLENNGGLALVYTHLDKTWLDLKTKKMKESIRERLEYITSKNVWLASAGEILDRFAVIKNINISYDNNLLTVTNTGADIINGLTLVSNKPKSLLINNKCFTSNKSKKIVIGSIKPLETLVFEIKKV